MTLQILAVLLLGLMAGSELNVALFAHPAFNRQPLEVHVPMRSSFASLFGHVMPFWMTGSTLLNLLLLLPFEHLNEAAWHLAVIAFSLQVLAVLFSLSAPCRSTTGLPDGLRPRFRAIGKPRSIAGICIIGCEPADWLRRSCYWF